MTNSTTRPTTVVPIGGTSAAPPARTPEGCAVIRLESVEISFEEFTPGYYDDIETREFVTAEELADQALCTVALNRPTQLARRRDAEPRMIEPSRKHHERHETAVRPGSPVEHPGKLRSRFDALLGPETLCHRTRMEDPGRGPGGTGQLTVRRLRRFARRRFNTLRPFLVLIRTRNPWVRRRRRLFGWKVRFISDPDRSNGSSDYSLASIPERTKSEW
jgi:hypothetical protein